ncbi:phospholipase D1-like isoform X2 [Daphnia pulicaria]|uniref:phospholipase D1-like isoform X2 n=1 Tax=Daphnia pulicaria TaxID=35523 RepID=UPI001EEA4435|nr:phospholipase D1-like isoform X2 [Daphnia pulicaria]
MLSVTDMKNIYIYIRRVVPGVPRDTVRGVPQKTRSALPAIQIFALSNYELSFLFVGRHQNNFIMDFVSNYPSITGEEDSSFVSTHSTLHDYDKQITARSIPNQSCFEDQHGFLLKNESEEEGIVPYPSIYYSHAVLLKGNLKVKILSYERSGSTIRANPNLYLIEVEYQHSKWILRRRYKHFQHLHNQLQLLRTSLNIPFPSKTHREQRASFKAELNKRKIKQNSIPRFPLVPEALVSLDQMELRMSQLENYLNAVLENVVYRNHFETMRFLEISQFSFVDQLGVKRKEGLVKKHNGDNSSVKYNIYCREEDGQAGCCCYIICCERFGFSGFWKRRWIFVKDSFFGYFRPATNEIRCILLMDQEFQVRTGYSETGLKYGMIVSNSCRKLVIKGLTKRETNEWIDCIQQVMNTTGSDFVQLKGENRFRSFVPARENAVCGWFVDGADFMSTVADFIENAKEEIMISDWWLSPEIYMKRPVVDGNKWRLDTILRRKAEEGVRVFVLLYKEVEMALGINSFYSKKILSQLHPNIRVLRHPDHIAGTGTLLWAHHEKLVVIDQATAFVGGIDLCFGRWDDEKHRLTDLGSASWSNSAIGMLNITSSHTKGQQKPGAVFHLAKTANQVTLGTVTSEATRFDCVSKEDNTDKLEEQEENPSTTKKSRKHKIVHFHDVKSKDNVLQSNILKKTFYREVSNKNKNQNEEPASNLNVANETHKECEGSTKLWVGKDYTNFIVKDSDHLDEPLTDSVDRTTTPRMPWHDIGCVVSGKSARDVARHFIQRWNATKVEKAKENIDFPFLVPKSYSICDPCLKTNNLTTFANCQVLRSSSTWSVGSRITEDSIHSAYIHAIENSEHFIYIENQFFITLASDSGVSNRVGAALYDRIVLAAERKSRFRVIVVLPLLPGFEGQIGTKSGIAMHAIMHWNYASISRFQFDFFILPISS